MTVLAIILSLAYFKIILRDEAPKGTSERKKALKIVQMAHERIANSRPLRFCDIEGYKLSLKAERSVYIHWAKSFFCPNFFQSLGSTKPHASILIFGERLK